MELEWNDLQALLRNLRRVGCTPKGAIILLYKIFIEDSKT
jgi:hypothetical protein